MNKLLTQVTSKASIFAALGDETRLSLLLQLGDGQLHSITQLSEGRPQTRQAVRKHLQILETVELVRAVKRGRENLFQAEPKTIERAKHSLELISNQWHNALVRLKNYAEQ